MRLVSACASPCRQVMGPCGGSCLSMVVAGLVDMPLWIRQARWGAGALLEPSTVAPAGVISSLKASATESALLPKSL